MVEHAPANLAADPATGLSGSPKAVAACPCCGSEAGRSFYRIDRVPVNSMLLLSDRHQATEFPVGDIDLRLCADCGFIYNRRFDQARLEYTEGYEPTQAYSATFNHWHQALAKQLIERYGLHGKQLVEIGCGGGEFLRLLCQLGDNRGVGFDPAYRGESSKDGGKVEFVKTLYSAADPRHAGDFICCKMTLEHIAQAAKFLTDLRQTLEQQPNTLVFFQVPDAERILADTAFWDIYYEHCSYFTAGSLARLFRRCGFDIVELNREYDGQYIAITARTGTGATAHSLESDLQQTEALVQRFSERFDKLKDDWQRRLNSDFQQGRRVVVWGSGSKGVGFLTTLALDQVIEYVVDINPNRQGCYMAGSGQEIVAPEFLQQYRPDVVVVMNSIYLSEIGAELKRLGLDPEVVTT